MKFSGILAILNQPHAVRSLLIQFITGGTLVAATTFLVQYVNTTMAAIVWAFPFSLIPTIFFLWQANEPIQKITSYVFSTTTSLIALLMFIVSFSVVSKHVPSIKNHKNGPLLALAVAFMFWMVGAYLMYKLDVGTWF